MRSFALLFCVFVLISTADAFEFLNPKTIQLTDAEAKLCADQGGCFVATQEALMKLLAHIELLERQAKETKGKSCA